MVDDFTKHYFLTFVFFNSKNMESALSEHLFVKLNNLFQDLLEPLDIMVDPIRAGDLNF
jgi:hypothetical protein